MKLSYFMALGALCSLLHSEKVSAGSECPTGGVYDATNFMCVRDNPKQGYHLSKYRNPGKFQRCALGHYFAGGKCKSDENSSGACSLGDTHNQKKNRCERPGKNPAAGYYPRESEPNKIFRCDNHHSYDKSSDSCK